MNKQTQLRMVGALVLVLLAGLVSIDFHPKEPSCSSFFRHGETLENRCGLAVDAGAENAELRVQANLSQGAMTWWLEDPQGIIRWQGSVSAEETAAGTTVEKSWSVSNPLPGRWNLKIKLNQAVGEYAAPWVVK